MTDTSGPIFIHSMFRCGSTYIFDVFRRSGKFYCFQESIHEFAFFHRGAVEGLSQAGKINEELRHPPLTEHYFSELQTVHDRWRDIITEKMIYADGFATADQTDAANYLQALATAAPKRPVFQECRTAFRVTPLKAILPGTHIALWRNPWDQWWSYKVAGYFDTANQIFLNAHVRPEVIDRLRGSIGFVPCDEGAISDQFEFYNARRPSSENSYRMFFTLWCLAALEARQSADIDLSIDLLSVDDTYRKTILNNLAERSVTGLDFDDCRIPAMNFSDSDEGFFDPLESEVFLNLKEAGTSKANLNWLRKRSRQYQHRESGVRAEGSILRSLVRTNEARAAEAVSTGLRNVEKSLELQSKVEDLRGQLAQTQLRETQANDELNRNASKIGQLNLLVNDKSSEVGQLTAQLDAKSSEIGQLTAQLDAKSSEIGQLTAQLDDKSSEIGQLKAQLDEKSSEIGQLAALLGEKSNELGLRYNELQTKASEIGQLYVRIDEKVYILGLREAELAQSTAALQDLQSVSAAQQESIAQKALALELAAADLNAARQKLQMAEDRLAQADRYAAKQRDARDAAEALVVEQASLIANLQSEEARLRAHISWQDARLEEVWRSTSWRLTAPMRDFRRYADQASTSLGTGFKSYARRGLIAGLGLLTAMPLLRKPAHLALKLSPPLDARLRQFAMSQRATSNSPAVADAPDGSKRSLAPWSGSMEDDAAIALEVLEQYAKR